MGIERERIEGEKKKMKKKKKKTYTGSRIFHSKSKKMLNKTENKFFFRVIDHITKLGLILSMKNEAPVDKCLRVVVIKEIKGSQYGVQLESAVRDRLAADDKYEEEEEVALEQLVEFFQSKYFKKDSVITYTFPATSSTAEILFTTEGKDSKIKVENENVVEMIKKWYLGGTRGVSPSTITNLANTLSVELSK